jgi:hypothetical protein
MVGPGHVDLGALITDLRSILQPLLEGSDSTPKVPTSRSTADVIG